MTDEEHDKLVDDIRKTATVQKVKPMYETIKYFSIFNNLILYSEYLSIRSDLKEITLRHFKSALEEIYPFMEDTDTNIENIKKIAKAIKIEQKKAEKFNYRKISRNTDSLKYLPRLKFSNELLNILISLDLDLNTIDTKFRFAFIHNSIFSFKNAKTIKETLSKNIFGQDRAINIISDAFKDDLLINKNKPKNIFFFLGPSGSGKTFLASKLPDVFSNYTYKFFNMTQYSFPDTEGNLIGTHRMWGNAKVGELTSYVRENPKSVIVFDEFDKANTSIQNALLTILNDGYLDDACGWCADGTPFHKDNVNEANCAENKMIYRVDFTDTILVFTTNLGSKLYNDHRFMENFEENLTYSQQLLYDVLSQETKTQRASSSSGGSSQTVAILPHFLSRLMQGKLILFNKLKLNDFIKIVDSNYTDFKNKLIEKYNVNIELTKNDKKYLTYLLILQLAPNVDARNVNAKAIKLLYTEILEKLEELEKNFIDIDKISIKISAKVKKYFDKNFSAMIKEETIISDFYRKNLVLKIDSKAKISNDKLIYTIHEVEHHKINSIKDFQGEDALVFEVPDTTFDDIAGNTLIKNRLNEIVYYLKNTQMLEKFNIDTPRGLLLYGKPGTGKTMLARAFANEADLPIIQTTGSKLLNPDHLKNIYAKAKEYAPSIIFIDEIDAIGQRDGNTYKDTIINQFLTELNGFADDKDKIVFTIAATNFKAKIDPAILRSGRIDLHIEVDTLDKEARKFFIQKLLKKPTYGKISIEKILFYTAGMTGADFEKVLRESSLEALRRDKKYITQEIIIEQINIVKYGNRIPEKSIDSILEETAYHEAGHAVISKVLMPHRPIEQITITPRDRSLGFVSYNNEDIDSNPSKKDLENRISISFAGRISQIKQFGDDGFDTGALSDLKQATRHAYIMVAHYGMDDNIGYINIDGIPNLQYEKENITDSDFLQADIELSVKKILKEIEKKTRIAVDENWDKIDMIAKLLIEKEVLDTDDINNIL